MNNEVWEKTAAFLMDLRCADRKRESIIHLTGCTEEKEKLNKQKEQYAKACNAVSGREQKVIECYVAQLQQMSFEEQQEAYCQGMVDMLQILSGLHLLPMNGNIQKLMEKF